MEVLLLMLFVVYLIANIAIFVLQGIDLGADLAWDGWKETIAYRHIIEFILFPTIFIEVSLIYLFSDGKSPLNKKVFKKKDKKYIDK